MREYRRSRVPLEDAHSSHGAEDTLCNPVAEDAHSRHDAEDTLCNPKS